MNWLERVAWLRESGDVLRLHTVRTIHQHTIAEHVFGAQCIALELCRQNEEQPGPILTALLTHDAPELETGDVPAPVKRANGGVRDTYHSMEAEVRATVGLQEQVLTAQQERIAKAADWLDLAYRCTEERRLGNRTTRLEQVFKNVTGYTVPLATRVRGVGDMLAEVHEEWNRARL